MSIEGASVESEAVGERGRKTLGSNVGSRNGEAEGEEAGGK